MKNLPATVSQKFCGEDFNVCIIILIGYVLYQALIQKDVFKL